jgi:hypothetical protein
MRRFVPVLALLSACRFAQTAQDPDTLADAIEAQALESIARCKKTAFDTRDHCRMAGGLECEETSKDVFRSCISRLTTSIDYTKGYLDALERYQEADQPFGLEIKIQ